MSKTYQEYIGHGWRCFHCDETFMTKGAAADHFGNYMNSTPGCILKVQVGDERGWLMELRRLQEENAHLRQQMDEEYWNQTAFNAHLKTLIQSFRPFRKCDSLRDVFNVYDSMEGRALAAEEHLATIPAEKLNKPSPECGCQSSDAMECNRLRYAGHPNPAIRTVITPCGCVRCHSEKVKS